MLPGAVMHAYHSSPITCVELSHIRYLGALTVDAAYYSMVSSQSTMPSHRFNKLRGKPKLVAVVLYCTHIIREQSSLVHPQVLPPGGNPALLESVLTDAHYWNLVLLSRFL